MSARDAEILMTRNRLKTDFWPSQLLPGVNTAPAHSHTAPAHPHYCPCPPAATTDWPCIRPCSSLAYIISSLHELMEKWLFRLFLLYYREKIGSMKQKGKMVLFYTLFSFEGPVKFLWAWDVLKFLQISGWNVLSVSLIFFYDFFTILLYSLKKLMFNMSK